MTCIIPRDLEEQLAARAAQQKTTIESLVHEAINLYLRMDGELLDELAAWQQVRLEAAARATEIAGHDNPPEQAGNQSLATFRRLQQEAGMTPEKAAQWNQVIYDARRSSDRPSVFCACCISMPAS